MKGMKGSDRTCDGTVEVLRSSLLIFWRWAARDDGTPPVQGVGADLKVSAARGLIVDVALTLRLSVIALCPVIRPYRNRWLGQW